MQASGSSTLNWGSEMGVFIRVAILLFLPIVACRATDSESALREMFTRQTGEIILPRGVTTLRQPLVVSGDAKDLIIRGAPGGSTLRASSRFEGKALIHLRGGVRITLRDFAIDGNRLALEKPIGFPPSEVPFVEFYQANGIVAENTRELAIENVQLRQIANYAVLVAASRQVRLLRLRITDSGSRNAKGRNNGSGGILLEEGTEDFQVLNSKLERVRGNGIWTHSRYTSPRNKDGLIAENEIRTTARDAIQVGHATNVRVDRNTGRQIGYPSAEVDVENQGWPVAIDTAGNVDKSIYVMNEFEELNGKCIDLDGFHHGEVRRNRCVNTRPAAEYPYGHFGIVMNNTNPDMRSEEILIIDNELDGMKYGGIFVIGRKHRIEKNRMRYLNSAECPESPRKIPCVFKQDEPDMLQSGVYVGRGAERPDPGTDNVIIDNLIMGHGMKERCIVFAPGVARGTHQLERNICLNPPVKSSK